MLQLSSLHSLASYVPMTRLDHLLYLFTVTFILGDRIFYFSLDSIFFVKNLRTKLYQWILYRWVTADNCCNSIFRHNMTYENFYVVHHLMFALVFVTARTLDDMNRQGQARSVDLMGYCSHA